jgi:hypothetical protein
MSAHDLFQDMGIPIPPAIEQAVDREVTSMLQLLEIGRLRSGIRIVAATCRIREPELAKLLDELLSMDLTQERRG